MAINFVQIGKHIGEIRKRRGLSQQKLSEIIDKSPTYVSYIEGGLKCMEYVAKISENEIARTVKLADLRHNSDLTRLDEIDDKARNRIEKYKAAIRLLSESKTSFCPYYDKGTDTWRVDFPDRDSEEGDLLYVASEYARTGLYYPYNVAVTAGKEYSGHAHSFEGVIQALLDDPAGFSIAGFEEFYSKQEQEMLLDIRNKLMNNIGEKASTAAKPDSSELL